MRGDKALREQLAIFLGTQAHMSLADAVKDFPLKDMNVKPPNVPYTFWHLLEHIRIAQWDIIDFIKNPDYEELEWPEGYWPAQERQGDQEGLGRDHCHVPERPEGDDRPRQEPADRPAREDPAR
jgi:hypothetical protein